MARSDEQILNEQELKSSLKKVFKLLTRALSDARKQYEDLMERKKEIRKKIKNGCRKTSGLSI